MSVCHDANKNEFILPVIKTPIFFAAILRQYMYACTCMPVKFYTDSLRFAGVIHKKKPILSK